MRISVCEFLRLTTQESWFYLSPGAWVSADLTKSVNRQANGTYLLTQKGRPPKTLRYYAGMTSNEARTVAAKKQKRRQRRGDR